MPEEQHLPVNWIDGMKIGKKHFQQTNLFVEESVRKMAAARLTDYNFGILPFEHSCRLIVLVDSNQTLQAELKSCRALTQNGSFITVDESETIELIVSLNDLLVKQHAQSTEAQVFYVLVSVNIFERLPAGEPDMEENPPRHPFTKSAIRLHILPSEQMNHIKWQSGLFLSKIIYHHREWQWSSEYIPPCTAVNSHPLLMNWHSKFRSLLENWELCCLKIIQKINIKTGNQSPALLAMNIQHLSEKILEQLVRQKTSFQWMVVKEAPIHLCIYLMDHIRYTHMLLQCFAEKDREEMLNYFGEWTETQAGMLESQTLRLFQLTYLHHDAAILLDELHRMYLVYTQIFQKLSQLEFIGKKKGQSVFVIEQEVVENKQATGNVVPKPNSRWSPLS